MTIEKWDPNTYGLILNSLADGIYITNPDRKILFWNRAAERITGWKGEEIVGRSCFDDILSHEDLSGTRLCGADSCPLHHAIIYDEPSTLPIMVYARSKNGRRIPVEVSVAPIHNEAGEVLGGIESFRDLTPLMDDLERARLIQEHSMRTELPSDPRITFAAHNVPMQYVSGDFYRIEQITPDTYAIMLADVTGHGVTAGLCAMQLRSLWEDSRELLPSPSAFVTHMNEKLFELTREDDSFATGFYAVLDVARHQLRYVLAGHPSPFLLRDKEIICFETKAPAIGLLPCGKFQEQELTLQPGDRILLYSDGAIEVCDRDDRELGERGLSELVQKNEGQLSSEALQRLTESIADYSQSTTLNDDVTFVGVTLHAVG
ncbi:MAG: SpoIIE family protein phosphatase [Verrucomicrobia bacterium]|nr:SpoIIE family protein phosphatase [Verrucomicrobiota bacterium]